jgi:nitrous oxide reductase
MQKEETKTSRSRRDFLRSALVAGAAAAVLAPQSVAAITEGEVVRADGDAKKGYRLTAHISAYYKSASC